MRRSRFAALLGLPLLLLSGSCATTTARPAAEAGYRVATLAPGEAKPALWVVKDADTTIYLFGTIHVLPEGLSWFDEAVRQAFDASGTLMLEMVEPPQSEMLPLVLKHGLLPQGQTLRGLMSAEQKARYEAAMTKAKLPVAAFDKFKPWFAAVTLTVQQLQSGGLTAEQGVEKNVTAAAKAANKRITAFETADEQLGFFDSLPMRTQLKFLDDVLNDSGNTAERLKTIVDSWAHGDAEALGRVLNEDMDDPIIMKTLLTDRNARWAKALKARLDQPGTVFVAVGAGHLAGKGSVQDDLKALGVSTQRILY